MCNIFLMMLDTVLKSLGETLPFDCLDVYRNGRHRTGVYSIYPHRDPNKPVKVRCEMDMLGGGWTVYFLIIVFLITAQVTGHRRSSY